MGSGGDSIQGIFPDLMTNEFRITSQNTQEYNCIAWAAGCQEKWWEPADGYFWPKGIPVNYSLDSLVAVYEWLGYEVCDDDELESGYDKIAIYGIGTEYEHAARQLPDGKWTSKIGFMEDIEHNRLNSLCSVYGAVQCIMRREKKTGG